MSAQRPIRTARHEVLLLPGSRAIHEELFGAIARAHRRIFLESYIVSSDAMGKELYVALDAARKRGCEVRVLYDPLGSEKTDPSFFDDLRASGVEVRSYGKLFDAAGSGLLGPRDHGRTIVIDDQAYTGGAAWGDQWLPTERGGRGWHDLCCRVTGPIVADFEALFLQRFAEGGGERGVADFDTSDRHPDLRLASDTPDRSHSLVYQEHVRAFQAARQRIWMVNAYFYPPREMIDALEAAARRGVDVRVIVPKDSDLPLFQRGARAEAREWAQIGFRLFEFAPVMMHAKYAIVDEDWGTVGTFNANMVSVGLSNEVNLFFRDPAAVAALAAQAEEDQAEALPVDLDALAERPVTQKAGDELAAAALAAADRLFGPR